MFAWFENRAGQWIRHVIDEDMPETRTIRTADFNGNGRVGMLGSAFAGHKVVWYENLGDPAREP